MKKNVDALKYLNLLLLPSLVYPIGRRSVTVRLAVIKAASTTFG